MFGYKTLFARIFAVCLLVLISALVLLNAFFLVALKKKTVSESILSLTGGAADINKAFSAYYENSDLGQDLLSCVMTEAGKTGAVVWVTDLYDHVIYELSGEQDTESYGAVFKTNKDLIAPTVRSGASAFTVNESSGNYYAPVITVGTAISAGGEITGAVYLSVRLSSLSETASLMIRQSLLGFLVGLIISAGLSFAVSRFIAFPLYQMNVAAAEISKGNFHQRIEEQGEGEIGDLTRTFNAMAAELEKYESTRESFVGNVSHELKSPLTAISGFVQGMADGTIPKEEHPQYLDIVLSECKRMNALITDLLDLARMESDQFVLNLQPFDINEVIRRCVINFLSKIEEKKIDLAVDISEEKTMVVADSDRIFQVLTNLIDNAVKFSEVGGSVKLWTDKKDDKIRVSIQNSGQIIPEADQKFIFDRFFKVDKSHNRKAQGTGIGLSIVREIINRHGERIWVNSRRGTGTVFTFTLTPEGKKQE